MKSFAFVFALMLITMPVVAQVIEYAECRTLAEYVPQAGVNYQPGVDVHGNTVVPADINAAPIDLPDVMAIPLSFDLAQRLPDPPEGMRADASVGFLEVYKDGRVVFQGRDLTPQVYAICRGQAPASDAGQQEAEPVGSTTTVKETNRYN